MRVARCLSAGLLGATLFFSGAAAYGQTSAAQADALFDKAVELMQQKKFAEACPSLVESQKLDPRPGTLFTLADCEVGAGKIASAVAHYKEYIGIQERMDGQLKKRHAERAGIAKKAIADLEPQVPTLKLTYSGDLPDGLVVLHDGVEFGQASLNTVLPVDPGEHVIVTQVPGRPDSEQRITIARRDNKVIELTISAATGPTGPDKPPGDTVPPAEGGLFSSTRGRIGVALAGVGVAGLALGGVMGGLALSGKATVDEHCNGLDCDATGFAAVEEGRTFGTVSTIGLAAGGALAAVGAVLILTAPRSSAAPPKTGTTAYLKASAGPQGVFFSLQGEL